MLILRHLMTLSIGIIVALIYGTSTLAQILPSSESSTNQIDSGTNLPENPGEKSLSIPRAQQLLEPSPDTAREPFSVPENLNPSANPLLFPTQSREVEIATVQPVTLEEAIELAFNNNKDLQRTRVELERAQAELTVARADLYPDVGTSVDLSRSVSPSSRRALERANRIQPDDPDNPFQVEQARQQRQAARESAQPLADTVVSGVVELNYGIYTGGERSARIQRAEREIQRNRLEVERISEQVRFDTTQAYYSLQQADAGVAIGQAAVEDASVSLRDAQLLEQAGLGTRFSVLQAEVDLATANQELTQSIAQQRVSRRRLAEILGLGQQVELTARDEITEAGTWNLSLEETIVMAYKNRAELEQQLLQKEISQKDSLIALAAIKPQVDFIARYQYDYNFDDSFSIADGYSFIARLRWNFFDGGRAFARARQAYRNMDVADTEFARQRNAIRLQVEEAYFNLIANQENIDTASKNVETATEQLRLARLRFQAGVGTQTDVINSQRDLTNARSRFLDAIVNYNQSLNALQRAVSNLPDNKLFEVR